MKILVLSSGGLDSTTCIGMAVNEYGSKNVASASIIYGQKHIKEIEAARAVAKYYGIEHFEIELTEVFKFSNCSLLSHSTKKISHKSYSEQIKETKNGRVGTYVPFRNGLLLSTATALADSIFYGEDVYIYYGAHADDAAGRAYADCTPEFTKAINEAIEQGTYDKVHVVAPLLYFNKTEVVALGHCLRVPFELTWSCYEGGEKQCGVCGTCRDRKKAFELNRLKDPIEYEV